MILRTAPSGAVFYAGRGCVIWPPFIGAALSQNDRSALFAQQMSFFVLPLPQRKANTSAHSS
ncbi:hypothetical protein TAL182_CH01658 [Rhizobium sp. TAL182]|nr:hypothetical protein TAL182_CH01658 [Rhizobium sp. TAL182]